MDKYLRDYAERGTAAIADIPAGEPWRQVVVIPVCNESAGILRPLPEGPGRSLMVLVVNETEAASRKVALANRDFAAEVHRRFRQCWQSAADFGLTLFNDPASPRDVLLVDRFSDGSRFPPGGGVGHARKTGADLAAFLISQQRVSSPWIHCSDADVRLPQRYFSCSAAIGNRTAQNTAALVYPFRHVVARDDPHVATPEGEQQKIIQVTRLYEYSLRYYVAGLNYARSPYAFHTIGSTMAINALHYAKVRGFPRRQAGEDFYLLNKLAKVGSVRQLEVETECEPIDIAARLSDRVPFGTGAATGKLMQLEDPAREFLLYHPSVFDLLGSWIGSLPAFWQERSDDPGAVLPKKDLPLLIGGLEQAGVADALQHALRQSSDASQFMRQMHTWFDAFRTLKLIHHLRDHFLPSISFQALMTEYRPDHLMGHESSLPPLQDSLRNLQW
ncbi:MAG: hypothetical protein GWP58_09905 [Gammaproteobacteria bacterium]|nr:hypothetical protein [Gammaproteobacteria bacterium]